MNFIHTADLHIGESRNIIVDYIPRQWKMLTEILRIAVKKEASFILICGDIFHRKDVRETERMIFLNFLIAAEEHMPVYIINGQHDLLDANLTSLNHIKSLIDSKTFKRHKIALFRPELWNHGKLKILGIPHIRKRQEPLEDLILEHTPDIAMVHECFIGAHTDTGWLAEEGKGYHTAPKKGFGYLACGDIHKCQKVAPRAFYSGSPMQHNFGDDAKRGILALDTEEGFEAPKMIRLQGIKPLITIRSDEDVDELPDAYIRLEQIAGKEIKNKEILEKAVKIQVRVEEQKPILIPEKEDAQALLDPLVEFLAKMGLSSKQQQEAVRISEKLLKKI